MELINIKDISFADILKNTTSNFPQKTALIKEGKKMSYEGINSRVNSLGHGLIDIGIKKGERIACLLRGSIENVEVNFAAAKIGAVLVPLNYNLNRWELQNLLQHCEAKLLIAETSFYNNIISMDKSFLKNIKLIWVGSSQNSLSYEKFISSYPRLEVYASISGNDPCSIMYTSGTTGTPKGVIRTHANNFFAAVQMSIFSPFRHNDIVLYCYPMYTVRFYNVFIPAILGASTSILIEEFSPEVILKNIQEYGVNFLFLTPRMWKQLIEHPHFSKYNLSSLQRIMTGGSPVPVETKLLLMKTFPNTLIYEIWGTTEGGVIGLSTEESTNKIGSVGLPLCFTQAKLVDEQDLPVTPGKTGSLIIRGNSVAESYLKNPLETQQNFDSHGWFYTDDLARTDDNGYIYIVGRKSDTITYDTTRIYPREIEEILQNHPKVVEAAAFGIPHHSFGEILAAAVVIKKGSIVTEDELKEYVIQYLAYYKKPHQIFFVDSLPKNTSGKVIKNKIKSYCLEN